MKILFIDDEFEVEVLAKAIQARHPNDKVELVDDLMSAKKKLWSEKFDVVIADIMMPADNEAVPQSADESGLIAGLLLIQLVQSDQICVNKQTPFVILTGLTPSEHEKVSKAEEEYGEYFLIKPEHPDTVYGVISNAAKKK